MLIMRSILHRHHQSHRHQSHGSYPSRAHHNEQADPHRLINQRWAAAEGRRFGAGEAGPTIDVDQPVRYGGRGLDMCGAWIGRGAYGAAVWFSRGPI